MTTNLPTTADQAEVARVRASSTPVTVVPTRAPEVHREVLGFLGRLVAWLVIFIAAAILAVMVVIPRIGGATPYTVLTGSMTGTYNPGSLVVTKPASPNELGIGSPITYQLKSGKPEVVTHRIIEVQTGQDGKVTYITKGDANPSPDPRPVKSEQVRGRVWYSVPYLGYLNSALNGQQHQLLVTVTAGALLLYAALALVGAVADRLRRWSP